MTSIERGLDAPMDPKATGALIGGVSEKTLAQWRWLGVGPAYVKVGHRVRYRRADVERWLDSRTVAPKRGG